MAANSVRRLLVPLYDRVLINPLKPSNTTTSGIVLPESATQSDTLTGEVIAVGKDNVAVTVGDTVLLPPHSTDNIQFNGKDYVLIAEQEILGILRDTDKPLKTVKKHSSIPDIENPPS
eukprot:TRINITY_DN2242_c0_g1_i1.p1 TRINITY_DN2242_c0_g1~~TRINITY_DN2242_c0_g1_i1.p1  ORF type:complete len:118 (-),score=27.09 TRINITY_DN2242_c0_g1_i1:65-418(-)